MDKVQQIIELIKKERDYYEKLTDSRACRDEDDYSVSVAKELVLDEILDKISSLLVASPHTISEKEKENEYPKLKSEELETDLQNFVGEYSFNIDSELFHTLSKEQQSLWRNDVENALVNGVQWQKEKMIKDAVEVEYWDGNLFCNELREKYKDGDIVKIIIIKEN